MKNGVLGTYSQSPCENPVSKDVTIYTSLSRGWHGKAAWLAGCPSPWNLHRALGAFPSSCLESVMCECVGRGVGRAGG